MVADLSDTSEIYKCNLALQDPSKILLAYSKISRSCLQGVSLGHYLAAVSLHQIISELRFNLQQRINSMFFGTSCRLRLSRLFKSAADDLKASFIQFIERTIEYIDEYYLLKKKNKNGSIIKPERISPSAIYIAINSCSLPSVHNTKWDDITKYIDLFQIKDLIKDELFNEFVDIQVMFKSIQEKNIIR